MPVGTNAEAQEQFDQISEAAMELRPKWAGTATSSMEGPYVYATQATTPMYMAPLNNIVNSTSSCITDGTCMTLGGMSVIATTAQTDWTQQSDSSAPWTQRTPDGSVALMVSSSSLGLFHDDIPAAEASATGIVASLLALDAVIRQYAVNGYLGQSSFPQVYVFFFVGEEYDRIGSGRLLRDTQNFTCVRVSGDNRTCNFPYTTLNFTTVNFEHIQHFIHVEQLGSRYHFLPMSMLQQIRHRQNSNH